MRPEKYEFFPRTGRAETWTCGDCGRVHEVSSSSELGLCRCLYEEEYKLRWDPDRPKDYDD